jgi:hypothetical protein
VVSSLDEHREHTVLVHQPHGAKACSSRLTEPTATVADSSDAGPAGGNNKGASAVPNVTAADLFPS